MTSFRLRRRRRRRPRALLAPIDPERAFVQQVLLTGLCLTRLVDDLADALEQEGGHPSAPPAVTTVCEALLETSRPVLRAAGPEALVAASALVGAVQDRVLDELEAAAARDGA